MDIQTRRDIAAPIDVVFQSVTDFPAFERQVLRRGAELQRLDNPQTNGVGASWQIDFEFRGRERRLTLAVTEMDPPNGLRFEGDSQGMGFLGSVDLIALSRQQTRLTLAVNVTPKTLAARLLVQSLKLARGMINGRIDARLEQFAKDIEFRHSRAGQNRR